MEGEQSHVGAQALPNRPQRGAVALIEPHLPKRPPMRSQAHPLAPPDSAILHVLCTGCSWRMLPHDFPAWVYHDFCRWRKNGTWEQLNAALVKTLREAQGQAAEPGRVSVDSQSVKTTARGAYVAGMGAKALGGSGQRRVDSCGSGARGGRARGRELLRQAVESGRLQRVARVWVDGGYAGGFEAWVRESLGWQVEVVRRRGRAF
ncbi:MAG: transposase, partial [Thermoflexales bacterium]|nr:transposase [Thermoflexales bacterium]